MSVEYHYGSPRRVDTIVVAAQHAPEVSQEQIEADIMEHVVRYVVPPAMLDDRTRHFINSTGRFVVGGPMGDAGLTGRKIIVDTYGGMVPHGGGAFSGKDPTKVDRSGAYAARWVAKNVVAAGPGRSLPVADRLHHRRGPAVSLNVETFGTGRHRRRPNREARPRVL